MSASIINVHSHPILPAYRKALGKASGNPSDCLEGAGPALCPLTAPARSLSQMAARKA
jgi:hypothetical protein